MLGERKGLTILSINNVFVRCLEYLCPFAQSRGLSLPDVGRPAVSELICYEQMVLTIYTTEHMHVAFLYVEEKH